MRKYGKTDANQSEIVKALRAIGATVTSTAAVGQGFPDLAVGINRRTYLLEVKDGSKPPSARNLTPDEIRWFLEWKGHVTIVHNVEDALRAVGAIVQ